MPSNYTPNYNLNQWAAEDRVLRTDFNVDNAKIDAALKSLNQKADGRAQIVVGSYTGDGSASRSISLGFAPKAVLVMSNGLTSYINGSITMIYGGLAVSGSDCRGENSPAVELSYNGFRVFCSNYQGRSIIQTNLADRQYQYIAFI